MLIIIFYQVSNSFPPPEKKRRQARAKAHYKNYVAQRRREAWRNYQSYLQQQQRLARQQHVRRIAGQVRQVFFEAFPEFQSASNRGAFIRGLVLELVSRLYQGHSGLSPEYQNKLDELIQDASAAFEIRQTLMRWYREQQENIRVDFEAGNITQEDMDDELEQLTSIYNDAMQSIIFS